MRKVRIKAVMEALDVILGNRASGFYTNDELKKIREDEKERDRLTAQVVRKLPVDVRETEAYQTAKWWKKLYLLFNQALDNNRAECTIPEDVLRDLARFLLPHILEMYQSEEGKKQLEAWKAEQEKEQAKVITPDKSKSGD